MRTTLPHLSQRAFPPLRRSRLTTLQVNVGYRCNQSCVHCHVAAGPDRTEAMTRETMREIVQFLDASAVRTVDITGGAPELNPHFRELVAHLRSRGLRIIDRCNLTVLEQPGQSDLAEFLAEHAVEVVASLPCYLEENVERQRGKGVFESSLRGLRRLNALGYGQPGSGLALNLVYNPQGPALPPAQQALEHAYREHLGREYGVSFDALFVLANMPIQRFGSMLLSKGRFEEYMTLLVHAYDERNLEHVMCRSLVSVDWRGYVYDCDFNQMLDLPLPGSGRVHIRDLVGIDIENRPIAVMDHCYGCTAGQGSSCGGALAA